MGHEMHILEGFILDSNDFGESGRILKILTKEFGVMSVVATGVRELHSKMRGSMDVLQLVTFEYVEGREVNRLTGIHEKMKFENLLSGEDILKKRRVISNVVNFVLRTVVGETHNEKLWDSFLEGLEILVKDKSELVPLFLKEGDLGGVFYGILEIIWLIKILVSLGYWEEGRYDHFTQANFDHLSVEENKKEIVEEINKAIRSTHL